MSIILKLIVFALVGYVSGRVVGNLDEILLELKRIRKSEKSLEKD